MAETLERRRNMDIIKEADFRKEIKSAPKSAYLFFGEEDYMKSFALKAASEAISPDPSLSFFNEMKLDALSYSADALLDAIMPLPMGADRKLITVSGVDINALKASELDALFSVLSQLDDYDYNTVIINASSDRFDFGAMPKRPSSLLKRFSEHLCLVYFERNTPARLASWVGKHFAHNGAVASPDICAFVIDRCGRNMYNLASEVDKISFYTLSQGRNEITREDVVSISTSAEEFDTFALTNAIGARKKDEALRILRDMKFRRLDPVIILSEISSLVSNMTAVATLRADGLTQGEIADVLSIHEYRVGLMMKTSISLDVCRNMLEKCKAADLELKSGRGGYITIEKLICSI